MLPSLAWRSEVVLAILRSPLRLGTGRHHGKTGVVYQGINTSRSCLQFGGKCKSSYPINLLRKRAQDSSLAQVGAVSAHFGKNTKN